jgi:hypothetical protein
MGKVGGIILLVVALGIALYFVQSGGAAKLGSAFKPPATATSTVASTSSTGASTKTASTTASSTNPFVIFLNELFHPIAPVGPTIPQGGSNYGSGGEVYTEGSGSNGSGSGNGGSGNSAIPPSEIPPGLTAAQLSPYFHDVNFATVGTAEIELYTYENYNEPTTTIDITGWEIKTNHGGEYIPQAVNIYDPDAAPVLSDIILTSSQDDEVYFYASSAPQNVRINSCMGYLNQTNQFNPSLPDNCPPVSTTAISSFSGACQNYIESLDCNPVNMSNPNIPRNDYACQQYLENNFTYDSCITNHSHDSNFLSNEWYIWMGSTPLDEYHDNVELLDKNGLVVDTYSY